MHAIKTHFMRSGYLYFGFVSSGAYSIVFYYFFMDVYCGTVKVM